MFCVSALPVAQKKLSRKVARFPWIYPVDLPFSGVIQRVLLSAVAITFNSLYMYSVYVLKWNCEDE